MPCRRVMFEGINDHLNKMFSFVFLLVLLLLLLLFLFFVVVVVFCSFLRAHRSNYAYRKIRMGNFVKYSAHFIVQQVGSYHCYLYPQ